MRAGARNQGLSFHSARKRATRWLLCDGNARKYVNIAAQEQIEWASMSDLDRLMFESFLFTMVSRQASKKGIEYVCLDPLPIRAALWWPACAIKPLSKKPPTHTRTSLALCCKSGLQV